MTIDEYIRELASGLHLGRRRCAAVLDEVLDHLSESANAAVRRGIAPLEAQINAVATFGVLEDVIRQFNAAAGARAMRRIPMVTAATGIVVISVFLSIARSQPRTGHSASVAMQVSFFAAILGFQLALAAGIRGASRAATVWRTSAAFANDRSLVRRSAVISMGALCMGALALTVNFFFDARQGSHANAVALVAAGAAMNVVAIAGLVMSLHLRVNPGDTDSHPAQDTPHVMFLGESIVARLYRHPVAACTLATFVASAWAINGSEATFPSALWWGIGEAITVIAAFIWLGPTLELRSAKTT